MKKMMISDAQGNVKIVFKDHKVSMQLVTTIDSCRASMFELKFSKSTKMHLLKTEKGTDKL